MSTEKKVKYVAEPVVHASQVYADEKAKGVAAMEAAIAATNAATNGLEDPYKDQYAVILPKSNEIDYTQSNADRAIKDYQDKELANVVDSIAPAKVDAPVIHDDVPIIDIPIEYESPTEEMKKFEEDKKRKSDLAFMDEYWRSMYTPEDAEADEKKKKAALWIIAAQMLGDSIAALGNSYFTAKGANAMQVNPGAGKAAAATYQLHQDVRNAQQKVAKARLDATAQKYQMELAARKYEDDLKQQGIDNTIKLGNLEISRAKMLQDAGYQTKMLDLRAQELIQNGVKADQAYRISMEELGIKREQIRLSEKELDARIDGSYYTGNRAKWTPISTSKGNMEINDKGYSIERLKQYAGMIADSSGDDELAALIATLDGNKPESVNALRQKVGEALNDPANEALVDAMIKDGVLRVTEADETTGTTEVKKPNPMKE